MHIVLYHDALIPPPKYGGTERIIYWLARALVDLGQRVTVIAKAGSRIEGAQVHELTPKKSDRWEDRVPSEADILHLWGTPEVTPKKPFLVTIQGNGRPGEIFHPNTVFISRNHADNHGSSHFVYNGIDPESYPCDPESERQDYLVFLAKASWKVKNLAGAIEIARAVNKPLFVMGSRDWPLRLQRRLPSFNGVRYLGMVGDVEKVQYLRKARALLFPVLWPEPFGIAVTEALASGCAVYGTPYGSLPEIVSRDVGVLSNDASTLVRALREKKISPEICRNRVFQGFTHLQMAESYLSLYRQVLEAGHFSNPGASSIHSRFSHEASRLLPWQGLKT